MTSQSRAELSRPSFNAINRGVYIADNLPFLRSLNDECIDLVTIDPPFAKNDTFAEDMLKPPLSEEERATEARLLARWGINNARQAAEQGLAYSMAGYKDIWSWEDDVHEEWLESLDADYPGISKLIDATRYVHNDSTAAYLCYMAIRVIEIRRVLKPTGTLYFHCDHTANSYIRQLLDGVFGEGNFRNEVVWHYGKMANSPRNFPQNHDTIFRYSKDEECYKFRPIRGDDSEYKARYSRFLTGNQVLWGKVKHKSDRLIDGRARRVRKELGRELKDDDVLFDFDIEFKHQSDVLYVPILKGNSKERTGYPTQKPVALARRLIEASTEPGDVVLDCFAGCASSGVAAEMLGRQWVACDFNPRAWTVFKRQFNKESLVLLRCNDETSNQQVIGTEPQVSVHGPAELPVRTSPISDIQPPTFAPPERKFKVPASIIPESEMLRMLLELSDYVAWCCGFANRRPDGSVVRTTRNFHLDHIDPKSKDGSNQIPNRAPLCPYHNIRKGNQRIHLSEYREQLAMAGEMLVETTGDLIDLAEAQQHSYDLYADARMRLNPQATSNRS